MADDVVEGMSGTPALPAWEWNEKAKVFVPRCPRCNADVIVSAGKMTCNIVGYSHYEAPADAVIMTALGRLNDGED